jgi:hypothetical protein
MAEEVHLKRNFQKLMVRRLRIDQGVNPRQEIRSKKEEVN